MNSVNLSAKQEALPARQRFNGAWVLIALAMAVLYVPTGIDLYRTFWRTDEQGHGPIIIAIALWLLWRRRGDYVGLPAKAANGVGTALMVTGLLAYALGRSQSIVQAEAASFLMVIAALLTFWRGLRGLRLAAFPLFFLLFMIPLPGVFVQMLTVPLKSAVSYVAENLLYWAGYPIARAGVVLQIGQYQLLVADACAGLNSMFTLESLGLLYLNVMQHSSRLRNVLLALLIIPISFTSNVVRVMVLVLVTYYFGDAAGQGFVHGAAGMVLFIVALSLMLVVDSVLAKVLKKREPRHA